MNETGIEVWPTQALSGWRNDYFLADEWRAQIVQNNPPCSQSEAYSKDGALVLDAELLLETFGRWNDFRRLSSDGPFDNLNHQLLEISQRLNGTRDFFADHRQAANSAWVRFVEAYCPEPDGEVPESIDLARWHASTCSRLQDYPYFYKQSIHSAINELDVAVLPEFFKSISSKLENEERCPIMLISAFWCHPDLPLWMMTHEQSNVVVDGILRALGDEKGMAFSAYAQAVHRSSLTPWPRNNPHPITEVVVFTDEPSESGSSSLRRIDRLRLRPRVVSELRNQWNPDRASDRWADIRAVFPEEEACSVRRIDWEE